MDTTRRSSVRVTSAAFQRRLEPEPEAAVKKFFKIINLSTVKEKKMVKNKHNRLLLKKISFFKLISCLHAWILQKIPARFVRLGPKLSDKVTVETPVGFKRSIGIKRIGDEVWFDNGWSEFAKAHSLSEGHFLLFHYTENSSFRVMIFGVSASEIKYPLDQVNVIGSDDDEVVEVMSGEEKEEIARCESGVIDLEELLKKKPSVGNVKSEYVTIFVGACLLKKGLGFCVFYVIWWLFFSVVDDDDDDEESDSMDEVDEDNRAWKG